MQLQPYNVHYSPTANSTIPFLPRDAVRKRGTCCRPMSVCPSVCPSHSYIVSRRLKISIFILLGPRHCSVLSPSAVRIPTAFNKSGLRKNRNFRPIFRYRPAQGYYGRVIGSRSVSVPMTLSDLKRRTRWAQFFRQIAVIRSYSWTNSDQSQHGSPRGKSVFVRASNTSVTKRVVTYRGGACFFFLGGAATPLHIAANASRGLSAIAEFIVV